MGKLISSARRISLAAWGTLVRVSFYILLYLCSYNERPRCRGYIIDGAQMFCILRCANPYVFSLRPVVCIQCKGSKVHCHRGCRISRSSGDYNLVGSVEKEVHQAVCHVQRCHPYGKLDPLLLDLCSLIPTDPHLEPNFGPHHIATPQFRLGRSPDWRVDANLDRVLHHGTVFQCGCTFVYLLYGGGICAIGIRRRDPDFFKVLCKQHTLDHHGSRS
jgi:hypothetical protein